MGAHACARGPDGPRSRPGSCGRAGTRGRGGGEVAWAASAMDRLAADPSHAVSSCAPMPMSSTSHSPWSVNSWVMSASGDAVTQPLQQLDAQEGADLDGRQEPEPDLAAMVRPTAAHEARRRRRCSTPRTIDGSSSHSHSWPDAARTWAWTCPSG